MVQIFGGADTAGSAFEHAMAMKRAVGIGTSEGFGEEKWPGHAAEVRAGLLWSRGASPSREALVPRLGGVFLVLVEKLLGFGGEPADWKRLLRRHLVRHHVSRGRSQACPFAPGGRSRLLVVTVLEIWRQGPPEDVVVRLVELCLVACENEMVDENVVTSPEDGVYLHRNKKAKFSTASQTLPQKSSSWGGHCVLFSPLRTSLDRIRAWSRTLIGILGDMRWDLCCWDTRARAVCECVVSFPLCLG